jgi:predicted DsbA family dithiol-disulfide isomerase
MAKTLSIDLFSDVVCPWCYIGAAHLEAALRTLAAQEISVAVAHHPYLLDPDTPPGGVDLRARLRAKYGGDPGRLFARVEEAGRAAGLALDFARTTRAYSTVGAHTLLRHAAPRGTQPALARALFAGYFDEARDIGDPEVLAAIGAGHGFAADEARALSGDEDERALTRRLAAAAVARGVRGVPLFVFNQRVALSGAQPPEALVEAARAALDD